MSSILTAYLVYFNERNHFINLVPDTLF